MQGLDDAFTAYFKLEIVLMTSWPLLLLRPSIGHMGGITADMSSVGRRMDLHGCMRANWKALWWNSLMYRVKHLWASWSSGRFMLFIASFAGSASVRALPRHVRQHLAKQLSLMCFVKGSRSYSSFATGLVAGRHVEVLGVIARSDVGFTLS